MTTKKTDSRIARWFRKVIQNNRSPYRWYDIDHRGM